MLSMIFAISIFPHFGRRGTVTISDDGAIPKLHCSMAPIHTKLPIGFKLFCYKVKELNSP